MASGRHFFGHLDLARANRGGLDVVLQPTFSQ